MRRATSLTDTQVGILIDAWKAGVINIEQVFQLAALDRRAMRFRLIRGRDSGAETANNSVTAEMREDALRHTVNAVVAQNRDVMRLCHAYGDPGLDD